MSTTVEVPGYLAGKWTIDPVHSDVAFSVRHMMVSRVRGHFTRIEGEIVLAENPLDSSATAHIDLTSIDTNDPTRDNDLRSANFFEVETHPDMVYRSTAVHRAGDGFLVDGELTLHQITRPVQLKVEVNGFATDPYGNQRCGFSATTEIDRTDFGIRTNIPMDGGGVVIGEKISVAIEVEAILQQQPASA
jgi:polyisoprenoid-binding protein YceI